LAPATRLMAGLRFGHKALVIGAAFMLTCGVLAGILVVRSNTEIQAVQRERSAVQGLSHLQQSMLAMQAHRQKQVRAAAGTPVPAEELAADAANARRQLDAAGRWASSRIADAALAAAFKDASAAWSAAAADTSRSEPAAAIGQVNVLMIHISSRTATSHTLVPQVHY